MYAFAGARAPRPCGAVAAASSVAHVQFRVPKRVRFGQTLSIVTSTSGWQPSPDLAMQWSEGDEWRVTADFKAGDELEYKYVVIGPSGVEEWQTGGNRKLSLTVPGGASLTVVDKWDGPDQVISVEEPKNGASPVLPLPQVPPKLQESLLSKSKLTAPKKSEPSQKQDSPPPRINGKLTKKELKALLEKKGLPTTGRKLDLLARLQKAMGSKD